jgi:flagellar hook-length control protein FliK
MDSKVAAMVRSVTVTPGTTGSATDKLTDTTIVTPSPVATPTAESIARDANRVVSVSADGRRDTKRDAEIRQRQIEQQINVALRSGTPEIRMQLYPPGLGQVIIRLALDGQKLRLSMMSDNEDASASLALTEAGLRDALARDGYSLAGFDVHDKGEKNRRQQSWADTATQPTTPAAEGDAFSVDVTA